MATDPSAEQSALPHRLVRGLNSPLRVRFHVLIVIGTVVATLAVWIEGMGAEDTARDFASREFQARTSAAAARRSLRSWNPATCCRSQFRCRPGASPLTADARL